MSLKPRGAKARRSTAKQRRVAAKAAAAVADLSRVAAPARQGLTEPAPAASAVPPATPCHRAAPRGLERDSYSATAFAELLDRSTHAAMARVTFGLSPAAVASAYFDWLTHLATSPGKLLKLGEKAARKQQRFLRHAAECAVAREPIPPCIDPLPQDRRFRDPAWQAPPFSMLYQAFLLTQQWWHNATTGVHGVTRQHENEVSFGARQLLDMVSPANFILTNPVVLRQTQREMGLNLFRGFQHWLEDLDRLQGDKPPAGAEAFRPGVGVATTRGKVVFRNRLIELIQYAPTTETVRPEPILIVPAWIMKYYILDLSPENSMVRYLLSQGFTVYMVSWLNPGTEDRDLGFEDYVSLGAEAALDAVRRLQPDRRVHGVGYCLGGTLLAIAASALARVGDSAREGDSARDGKEPFASLTLLAAQTDFSEAGELQLFISESQLAFLSDMMWEQGFLDTKQMAGAFQLLRSNDLIWSRIVHDYLMGERAPLTDLMAWNADATRMPYRMHAEYLRQLYLNNDLTEGRFRVRGRPISVTDIDAPVFAVGTERDHVAPWRSVYKLHLFLDAPITFVLANGGHNAGIVSEPGHAGRHFRIAHAADGAGYRDPESWLEATAEQQGSWWPAWAEWLAARSGAPVAPPTLGDAAIGMAPLCDAPGLYALQP